MRQSTSKYAIEFVLCWPSTAVHVTYPQVEFVSPVRCSWRKLFFHLQVGYQLEIASGLGMGVCVRFPSQL